MNKKPALLFKIFFRMFVAAIYAWSGVAFAFTNPTQPPPGGAAAIVVDSSVDHKVGIGVAAPTAKLHVSAGGVTDALRVEVGGSVSLLVQNTTGNVGIGTANPSVRLTIKAASVNSTVFTVQNAAGVDKFFVKDNGDVTAGAITGFSLALLITPLGVASGGTGLTSTGASGNVLTSNGASWVSQALPAGIRPDNPISTTGAVGTTIVYSPICPVGKKVTGGGCYNTALCYQTSNTPVVPPGQWLCQWTSPCSGQGTAYAICE